MATFDPAGIARVAVYIEGSDGTKMIYDFPVVRDGVTINTEHDHDDWPYSKYGPTLYRGRPPHVRTDISFELHDVGPYTMWQPAPGSDPFEARKPAIESADPMITQDWRNQP